MFELIMCESIEKIILDLIRDSYPDSSTSSSRKVVAVLVTPGGALYTGYRGEKGDDHAERIAIEKAGENTKDSTLYSSLEPCVDIRPDQSVDSCAKLIVSKGISKVIFGLFDDNPQIEMKGWQFLRKNGIEVGYFTDELRSKLEEIAYDGPYNEASTKRGKRIRYVRAESGLKFGLKLDNIGSVEFRWSIVSPDKMDLIYGPPDTVSYSIDDSCFEDQVVPSMFRYSSHFCRLSVGEFAAIKIDEHRCVLVKLRGRSGDSIEFQWRVVE